MIYQSSTYRFSNNRPIDLRHIDFWSLQLIDLLSILIKAPLHSLISGSFDRDVPIFGMRNPWGLVTWNKRYFPQLRSYPLCYTGTSKDRTRLYKTLCLFITRNKREDPSSLISLFIHHQYIVWYKADQIYQSDKNSRLNLIISYPDFGKNISEGCQFFSTVNGRNNLTKIDS